jgi:hypothetical protein
MERDLSNENEMNFFYLDQRLLSALKEDNIDKYLMIVREKQIEELNQKKQIFQIKEEKENEKKERENEEYIKTMIKKEEELFEENRIEIRKRLDQRVQDRMIQEVKSIMIHQISDNIIRLENTVKDSLSVLENNMRKSKSIMDDVYVSYRSRYTIKTLTNE